MHHRVSVSIRVRALYLSPNSLWHLCFPSEENRCTTQDLLYICTVLLRGAEPVNWCRFTSYLLDNIKRLDLAAS